ACGVTACAGATCAPIAGIRTHQPGKCARVGDFCEYSERSCQASLSQAPGEQPRGGSRGGPPLAPFLIAPLPPKHRPHNHPAEDVPLPPCWLYFWQVSKRTLNW